MPLIVPENTGRLELSAVELKGMTGWPPALIEDYLNTIRYVNQLSSSINTGLGTMALQNADDVDIAGGSISNVIFDNISIDNVTIVSADITDARVSGTTTLNDLIVGGASSFAEDITLIQATADYTLHWNDPAAARLITIPDPGGDDAFVFNNNIATLTNKSFSLGSNTLTGTMAQYDSACSDGNFAYLNANQTFTGTNAFNNSVAIGTDDGIDYNPGSDIDIDIETLGVTGTPLRFWDESEDAWSQNKGLYISSGKVLIGKSTTATVQLLQIQSTDTNVALIESIAASSTSVGPDFLLRRSGGNANANDNIGRLRFDGTSDNGTSRIYGSLFCSAATVTNGAEVGIFRVQTILSGTLRTVADLGLGFALRSNGTLPTGGVITDGINSPSQYESGRKIGGVVASKFTSTGNVGAGVDTLHSVTVPAALLFNDGDMFVYKAAGTFAATANNKNIVASFGGTAVFTMGALAINNGTWDMEVRVIKDGTDSFRAVAVMTTNNALLVSTVQITAATALDLDIAQTFLVTGEATANNDVVMTQAKMNFNPA